MAQQVKVPATKPNDLGSILRIYMVVGERIDSLELPSGLHQQIMAHTHTMYLILYKQIEKSKGN